jgi:hypothetical protein
VKVANGWDIFGGILLLALIAVILTKANTAADIGAVGTAFTGALSTASAGGGPSGPAPAPKKAGK